MYVTYILTIILSVILIHSFQILTQKQVDNILQSTPCVSDDLKNVNLMQKLKDQGIVSYTDFLFLTSLLTKVSLLGVDSLWGGCMFIPADWGS